MLSGIAGFAIDCGYSAWIVVSLLVALLVFVGFNITRSAALKTLSDVYVELKAPDLNTGYPNTSTVTCSLHALPNESRADSATTHD